MHLLRHRHHPCNLRRNASLWTIVVFVIILQDNFLCNLHTVWTTFHMNSDLSSIWDSSSLSDILHYCLHHSWWRATSSSTSTCSDFDWRFIVISLLFLVFIIILILVIIRNSDFFNSLGFLFFSFNHFLNFIFVMMIIIFFRLFYFIIKVIFWIIFSNSKVIFCISFDGFIYGFFFFWLIHWFKLLLIIRNGVFFSIYPVIDGCSEKQSY